MSEPRFYFDTDHLNRAALTEFVDRYRKAILDPVHFPLQLRFYAGA